MYSRMKRKCSFIVLVVMVVSLLMVSGTPVHADSYSWMESAKKVKINSTIKGVARIISPRLSWIHGIAMKSTFILRPR